MYEIILNTAAEVGNIVIVQKLIKKVDNYNTALVFAAYNAHYDIVKLLIPYSNNINANDPTNETYGNIKNVEHNYNGAFISLLDNIECDEKIECCELLMPLVNNYNELLIYAVDKNLTWYVDVMMQNIKEIAPSYVINYYELLCHTKDDSIAKLLISLQQADNTSIDYNSIFLKIVDNEYYDEKKEIPYNPIKNNYKNNNLVKTIKIFIPLVNNYNDAFKVAFVNKREEGIETLIPYVNNYNEILDIITSHSVEDTERYGWSIYSSNYRFIDYLFPYATNFNKFFEKHKLTQNYVVNILKKYYDNLEEYMDILYSSFFPEDIGKLIFDYLLPKDTTLLEYFIQNLLVNKNKNGTEITLNIIRKLEN